MILQLAFWSLFTIVTGVQTAQSSSRFSIELTEIESSQVFILRDSGTGAEARIAPGRGANCYVYGFPVNGQWVDMLDPPPSFAEFEQFPIGFGNPILFPFPNRISDGGRFTFQGKEYQFDKWPDNPLHLHGLVWDKPFRVAETRVTSNESATILSSLDSREFPEIMRQFPLPFEMRVRYTLAASGLTCRVEVDNLGKMDLPMGVGFHPYFRVPLSADSSREKIWITVPASKYWELEAFVPTGVIADVDEATDLREGKLLAGFKSDDIYTGLTMVNGVSRSVIDDRGAGIKTVIESDLQFRELVLYTPDGRPAICFEPYTCPTDAINLEGKGIDAGVIVLKAGETFSGTVRFYAEF